MQVEEAKEYVKQSYGAIAASNESAGCCTDKACCGSDSAVGMNEDYHNLDGYLPDADLSLGCGIPTEIANIKKGDTVLDLGSGAGNDVFVARRIVGETGRVLGVDFTPEMVARAIANNNKLGYENVSFYEGDVENMHEIHDHTVDVVISNCVLNLVPNKEAVFGEIHRVLKEGGHFSISDIVYQGYLPAGVKEAAELYAGCVSGASENGSYLGVIKNVGFKNIEIKKERRIELPDELLLQHLNEDELQEYRASGAGIYSITVYANKLVEGACCVSNDSGCCTSEESKLPEAASCCDSASTGCC